MRSQEETGIGPDGWFGVIRNLVFAANVAGIVHFASLQYWAAHRFSATVDFYAKGEIGAAWSTFQLLLIGLLALGNWRVATRTGERLSLFWLVAAGGFVCLGANEWFRSHAYYERWFAYSSLPGADFLARSLGGIIMALCTVGGIFLGRAYSRELETRPRVAFYWGWGVGLYVIIGLIGLVRAGGPIGDIARMAAGVTLLCEAFLALGFFSDWWARLTASWRTSAAPGREATAGSRA